MTENRQDRVLLNGLDNLRKAAEKKLAEIGDSSMSVEEVAEAIGCTPARAQEFLEVFANRGWIEARGENLVGLVAAGRQALRDNGLIDY